ncbi:putative neck protein [Cronobacter phage S13]|jgi:hypothetical protein|uniref:Neck protein n=1 Tax=Cronobacter phage LPCS28 TaxID=2924885 RepID=A0AAE9GBA6_9CAUD|nr:putative neck protein [Cronobacter phage S13]YP_010665943.1 head-tail adaptor Ad2 [Cronobacter phage LPCS28]AIA64891.1 putative neck protein [Cronobacter phage S13]UNY47132.1 hypothetical protein EHEKIMEA_00250 [Cronobacter phage LPCS28]
MYNTANNPRELKDIILQRLGAPIVNVEVTEDQIFMSIQQALELYGEYHYEALNKSYLVINLSKEQAASGLIDLRQYKLFAITKIVRHGGAAMFTMDGNTTMNYFTDFIRGLASGIPVGGCGYFGPMGVFGNLSYYSSLMSYQNMMFDQLSPIPDYSFNANTGYLNIQGNHQEGELIIVEAFNKYYMELDQSKKSTIVGSSNAIVGACGATNVVGADNSWQNPYVGMDSPVVGACGSNEFQDQNVYNVRWVKDYATALVKRLNGHILGKHQGMQLPGGVTIDGDKLFLQADEEIKNLRDELYNLEEPLPVLMG